MDVSTDVDHFRGMPSASAMTANDSSKTCCDRNPLCVPRNLRIIFVGEATSSNRACVVGGVFVYLGRKAIGTVTDGAIAVKSIGSTSTPVHQHPSLIVVPHRRTAAGRPTARWRNGANCSYSHQCVLFANAKGEEVVSARAAAREIEKATRDPQSEEI
jgi:hypothetical protein